MAFLNQITKSLVLVLSLQKAEQKNPILCDLNASTVRIEALMLGKENKIQCQEGDRLQLTFLELSKNGGKLHLKSRVHSFIKVGTLSRKVGSPKG